MLCCCCLPLPRSGRPSQTYQAVSCLRRVRFSAVAHRAVFGYPWICFCVSFRSGLALGPGFSRCQGLPACLPKKVSESRLLSFLIHSVYCNITLLPLFGFRPDSVPIVGVGPPSFALSPRNTPNLALSSPKCPIDYLPFAECHHVWPPTPIPFWVSVDVDVRRCARLPCLAASQPLNPEFFFDAGHQRSIV